MQRHKGGAEGEIAVEVSKTIEEQRSVVAGVSHCAPLAAVIIRHDKLQAQLEQLLTEHADDVAGRASAYRREECPVCLDEIGHGGDLMLTRCGHTYHVDCLLETLADGSVRSCSLCRTEIAQIPDHGTCSGKVFAFMCLLRIAFDRAQAQTQRLTKMLEKELKSCTHDAKKLSFSQYVRRFLPGKWNTMETRIQQLLLHIDSLERAGAANTMGFKHLCSQLPYITGPRTSEHAAKYVTTLACVVDGPDGSTGTYASLRKAAEELASSLGFKMDLKLPPMHRIDLPAMPAAPLPRPTSANTDQPPASADKQPSSTADTSPSAVRTGAHTTPHANSGNEAVRPADVDRADGSGEVGPSPLPTSWPPAPSDTSSAAEWALVGADMGMGRRRARCESMEIANERMGDMHRQLVQLQSERRNDSRHEARQEPPHHAAEGTVPCQSEPRVPLLPLSPATSHHDHHPHEHTPSSPGVRHVSVLHVGAMRQAMAAEDLPTRPFGGIMCLWDAV
eukprot:Tamp_13898.p1 GENE.Tamp_13898~~Tamp_13898.p1  ORF type:complete len:505 (+),score=91.54 Tamp_13898:136-1650(+)